MKSLLQGVIKLLWSQFVIYYEAVLPFFYQTSNSTPNKTQ